VRLRLQKTSFRDSIRQDRRRKQQENKSSKPIQVQLQFCGPHRKASVSLIINSKDSYTVHFEGWHENFDEENEALGVFALGLSGDCRLREYYRGNFAHKWIVDFKEDGEWLEQSTTGLLVFPFWRKKRMRILQNTLIT
jgi:hypothetical protein